MKHFILLLCGAAVFAFGQTALAQEPSQTISGETDIERLPSKLDMFVQDAIDEGLLRPARPDGEPQSQAPEQREAAEVKPTSAGQSETAANGTQTASSDEAATYVCAEDSPFDFSVFRDASDYRDLDTWTGLVAEDPTPSARLVMARGWLSLGLATEARGELRGQDNQSARALRELALLFDQRSRPDMSLLEGIAACHADAALWSSIAMLKVSRPEGADLFDQSFSTFQRLPVRLRIEIALIVVPALDRMQRHDAVERVMGGFTPEQIAASSTLQFVQAIQHLAVGDVSAERLIRKAYRSGRFGSTPGAALRRHGFTVAAAFETQLVENFVTRIRTLPEDTPVDETFGVVLDDLNTAIDYEMTLTLADTPAAESEEARARLAAHYETLVDHDLESSDFLSNLKAMDGLLRGGDLLAGRDGTDKRLARASAIAASLGLKTMSEKLSGRVRNDDALAIAQAELAFQNGDHESLWTLVQDNPDATAVLKIAAIDAIGRGDRNAFSRLSARLPLDEQTALMLIEADAAAGHWIVPDLFYSLAEGSEDEAIQARANTVLTARPVDAGVPSQIALADVSLRLDRLRQSLNADTTEIR